MKKSKITLASLAALCALSVANSAGAVDYATLPTADSISQLPANAMEYNYKLGQWMTQRTIHAATVTGSTGGRVGECIEIRNNGELLPNMEIVGMRVDYAAWSFVKDHTFTNYSLYVKTNNPQNPSSSLKYLPTITINELAVTPSSDKSISCLFPTPIKCADYTEPGQSLFLGYYKDADTTVSVLPSWSRMTSEKFYYRWKSTRNGGTTWNNEATADQTTSQTQVPCITLYMRPVQQDSMIYTPTCNQVARWFQAVGGEIAGQRYQAVMFRAQDHPEYIGKKLIGISTSGHRTVKGIGRGKHRIWVSGITNDSLRQPDLSNILASDTAVYEQEQGGNVAYYVIEYYDSATKTWGPYRIKGSLSNPITINANTEFYAGTSFEITEFAKDGYNRYCFPMTPSDNCENQWNGWKAGLSSDDGDDVQWDDDPSTNTSGITWYNYKNVNLSISGVTQKISYGIPMTLFFAKDNISTDIETLTIGEQGQPEYYDLTGRRVVNPEHGIFIRRVGNKATKVAL